MRSEDVLYVQYVSGRERGEERGLRGGEGRGRGQKARRAVPCISCERGRERGGGKAEFRFLLRARWVSVGCLLNQDSRLAGLSLVVTLRLDGQTGFADLLIFAMDLRNLPRICVICAWLPAQLALLSGCIQT